MSDYDPTCPDDVAPREWARIRILAAELAAEKMQHSVTIADEHESRSAFQDRIRALEARIAIWEQCWDNIKLHQPGLREDNKPLAVAASYESLRLKLEHTVDEYDEKLSAELALRHTAEAYAARNALRVIEVEAALRKAVNYYTGHFGWCAKNGQMPMEHNRSYTHPTDWDNWRATVACTCDIEKLLPQTETKSAPGFCPECLMTGGHKLRCSKAETTPKPITTFTGWIQGSCDNCGKSAREHIGISMGCPQAETPDYGCTGCRSTPCICATLETKGEQG